MKNYKKSPIYQFLEILVIGLFRNHLFEMLKFLKIMKEGKNINFGGNLRASCLRLTHHWRASIQ